MLSREQNIVYTFLLLRENKQMQPLSTDRRFWMAGGLVSFALMALVLACSPAASDSSRTGPSDKGAEIMTTAIATETQAVLRPPIDENVPSQVETATFALG